ncbi:MAG TPA: hypothetical protein VKU41_33105 [Polyangiaceae bacterium]|nr:hypothetical protein [Polyangiaceae bacterium]
MANRAKIRKVKPPARKPVVDEGGPFIRAALLCERVLNDSDNAPSLIRIVDLATLTVDSLKRLPPIIVPISLFVSLRAGTRRGKFEMVVRCLRQSGELLRELPTPVEFTDGSTLANYTFALSSGLPGEGVYWFEVVFDGQLLTRVPLTVQVRIQPPPR